MVARGNLLAARPAFEPCGAAINKVGGVQFVVLIVPLFEAVELQASSAFEGFQWCQGQSAKSRCRSLTRMVNNIEYEIKYKKKEDC